MTVLWVSHLSALVLLALVVIVGGSPRPDLHFLGFAALAGLGEVVAMASVYDGPGRRLRRDRCSTWLRCWHRWLQWAPKQHLVRSRPSVSSRGSSRSAGDMLGLHGGTRVRVLHWPRRPKSHVRHHRALWSTADSSSLSMDLASEGGVAWAFLGAEDDLGRRPLRTILATGGPGPVRARTSVPGPTRCPRLFLGTRLYAVATTHGILGVVAVLSSLYPIVTIALTRIVLDEQVSTKQWIGAAIAVIGVGRGVIDGRASSLQPGGQPSNSAFRHLQDLGGVR